MGNRAVIVSSALGAEEEATTLLLEASTTNCCASKSLWFRTVPQKKLHSQLSLNLLWCPSTLDKRWSPDVVSIRAMMEVAEFFYFPWAPGESTRNAEEAGPDDSKSGEANSKFYIQVAPGTCHYQQAVIQPADLDVLNISSNLELYGKFCSQDWSWTHHSTWILVFREISRRELTDQSMLYPFPLQGCRAAQPSPDCCEGVRRCFADSRRINRWLVEMKKETQQEYRNCTMRHIDHMHS